MILLPLVSCPFWLLLILFLISFLYFLLLSFIVFINFSFPSPLPPPPLPPLFLFPPSLPSPLPPLLFFLLLLSLLFRFLLSCIQSSYVKFNASSFSRYYFFSS